MNTVRTRSDIKTIRLVDISDEGDMHTQDGYVACFEVILNPDTDTEESIGTYEPAQSGGRHRVQSWCGEYVWHPKYARSQMRRRLATWITKTIPATI